MADADAFRFDPRHRRDCRFAAIISAIMSESSSSSSSADSGGSSWHPQPRPEIAGIDNSGRGGLIFILLLLPAAMVVANLTFPGRVGFYITLIALFLFLLTLGRSISGRLFGVLINERN